MGTQTLHTKKTLAVLLLVIFAMSVTAASVSAASSCGKETATPKTGKSAESVNCGCGIGWYCPSGHCINDECNTNCRPYGTYKATPLKERKADISNNAVARPEQVIACTSCGGLNPGHEWCHGTCVGTECHGYCSPYGYGQAQSEKGCFAKSTAEQAKSEKISYAKSM